MLYFTQHNKKTNDYNLADCFKWYKNEKHGSIKTFTKYKEVVTELNSIFVNLLIYKGIDFKMPERLGHLSVKRKKCKFYSDTKGHVANNYPIDWFRTKKLWEEQYPGLSNEELKKIKNKKIIYNFNEHSAGEKCIFYWDKVMSNVKYQNFYWIRFNRTHKLNLSAALKNDNNLIYKYFKDGF